MLQRDPLHGCGTSLSYQDDGHPAEIDLTTASLDDLESFPPTQDVFPGERVSRDPLQQGQEAGG